ncbi:unnamed protein product [Mycena citricolor]|uniref:Ribonuclease H1 N-terminal domain-containing protein n=1 Tax=Mycena citricolor TaxID=2018698 RepID=A0AAD2HL46_9AGAR|nr:unnamed protein product [Mycena citricolor]
MATHDDERILELLAQLDLTENLLPTSPNLSQTTVALPSALRQRTITAQPTLYRIETRDATGNAIVGHTSEWSVAGSLVQDKPGSRAVSLSPRKTGRRPRPKAYVVFVGRRSGVFDLWSECKAQVSDYACCLYRGYSSKDRAEAAFVYAQQRGWTSAPGHFRYVPPIPVTDDDYEVYNPLSGREEDNDKRWYVVYRGLRPGVYRSSLESQLNVTGVSGQLFESVEGEALARKRFADAKRKGIRKTRSW